MKINKIIFSLLLLVLLLSTFKVKGQIITNKMERYFLSTHKIDYDFSNKTELVKMTSINVIMFILEMKSYINY